MMLTKTVLSFFIPLASLAGLSFLFWTPWLSLIEEWSRDEYSHGFLLPFVALLMAWHRLAGRKTTVEPSSFGFLWILGGLALLLVSELSTLRQLSYYAMLPCLVGLSMTYLGSKITKAAYLSFVLLLFAIPIPTFLFTNISLFLQLTSSSLGAFVLQSLGISVYLDGNIIDLGSQKLQVVEACNGLRYLFPLTSLSFLFACLLKDRFWKRVVLFLSAVPIGIGMNAARIAVIGILAQLGDVKVTEGFTHLFEGLVVFLLCLFVLFWESVLLTRIGPRGTFSLSLFSLPEQRVFIRPTCASKQALAVLLLIAGFAALNASKELHTAPTPGSLPMPLASYPMDIDGWHGKLNAIDPATLLALGLTDYVVADYSRPDIKAPINFYISYYDKQELLTSVHSPSTCLPGSGWSIDSVSDRTVPLANAPTATLTVSRLVAKQGTSKQIIYYWFDQRGRTITSQFAAKWYLLVDGLLKHRSDGALVRFVTPVLPTETEADADRRLAAFVAVSHPVIKRYLP